MSIIQISICIKFIVSFYFIRVWARSKTKPGPVFWMCFKPSPLNTLHNYQRILIRSEVLNYTLCSRPELNMQTVHENGDRFKLFMCTLRMCKGGWQSGAWVFDFVPADKFFVYSQKNLIFRRVFVFCWSEDDFYI